VRAFLFSSVSLFALAAAAQALSATRVDYLREVKPLLASKCLKCHGAGDQKGGLRLDTAQAILQGGDSGPSVIPAKSAESLLLQSVLGTAEDMKRMPLKKPPLSDADIAILRLWIDQGAQAPADERHWSFVPPVRAPEPVVRHAAWPRNAIDRFILARLEAENISPAPEADRPTLLRRLKLDLLGLPPTVEETDAFLADSRPDAYERAVDRFLASPHFGERWGRLWLDAARYADSNGYSIDAPRSMWPYRDWVIDALNRDLPFDQFTIEQLAGDLLPNATVAQRIATGFHRNTQINQEGGIDKEQFRIESLYDRVGTTGTVWLGLTIACAQCHDHKFDPLAQKDFYRMMAFFNDSDEPSLELASPEVLQERQRVRRDVAAKEAELAAYVKQHDDALSEWEADLTDEARAALSADAQASLNIEASKRTAKQRAALADAFLREDAEYRRRSKEIAVLKRKEPQIDAALVLARAAKPRPTHLFIKGDFTRLGDLVSPGVPQVLPPLATPAPSRLDLARWLVAPENPLTARVTVNRIWQQYFGKGLVETENDFGTQGLPPSHPELLDWLATELHARKWSLKAIHRAIVTSAAYRQSSKARPELGIVDPNNRLLARQSRFRLDAELVRDAGLSASGLLSPKIGGPSVYPPQPEGVMGLGQVKRVWAADQGENRYRRGLYTFFYRATPHPALSVFDAADGINSCTRRNRSNTPLQALTLLNDGAFTEMAEALADRVLREAPADDPARVSHAFRLCVARPPKPVELQRLLQLLKDERAAGGEGEETSPLAWITVSRVLLNLDETITRE
jgi:hypothetical protein